MNSPSGSENPANGNEYSTILAVATAFLSVAVTVYMRLISGWLLLILLIPNVIVWILHLSFTVYFTSKCSHRSVVAISIGASVLLVIGFGLQTDFGDDGHSWLTIMALFDSRPAETETIPRWWPIRGHPYLNLVLFVPLALSWIFLWKLATRQKKRKKGHGPEKDVRNPK